MYRPDTPRRILLCLDLEAGSRVLCRYAAELGRHCNDQLQVLHVFSAVLDGEARPRLQKKITSLLDQAGINSGRVEITLAEGIPDEIIPAHAQAQDIDLILLGRRRRSRIEKIYVGSTTSAVISLSSIPILVVPLARETVQATTGE